MFSSAFSSSHFYAYFATVDPYVPLFELAKVEAINDSEDNQNREVKQGY